VLGLAEPAATLAAEIAAAKAEGRYSEGVSDLQVMANTLSVCWSCAVLGT
jgi:hypothetical protein